MAEAIAQRRMHLERRVAHALAKIGGTTGTHSNDNQVVVTSERDAIAVLQRTRNDLLSVPRLSKAEFERLPLEQREHYISLVERLATSCASAIQFLSQKDGENKMSASMPKSHFTLDAIALVQRREEERRRQQLEAVRQQLIKKQSSSLCAVSAKRLLHRLKCIKIGATEKEHVQHFFQNSALLQPVSSLIASSADKQVKAAVVLYDLKHSFHVKNDLVAEECMLNAFAENAASISRNNEDSECKERRIEYQKQKQLVEEQNEQLQQRWPTLTPIEKLSYFVKPECKTQFDAIVKQGEAIGLKEPKIIKLLLPEREQAQQQPNSLYVDGFTGSFDQPPEKRVDPILEFGVHQFSLILAEKANVPETALLKYVSKEQLAQWIEQVQGNNKHIVDDLLVQTIRKQLGLDFIPIFQSYWKEITFFDEPENVQEKQSLVAVPNEQGIITVAAKPRNQFSAKKAAPSKL